MSVMTTTHASNENSVLTAFAELERLERARADFADAKGAARARVARQADELHELRARLESERPRARARVRRADEARRRQLERATERALAAAEAEHRERLARYQGELEAKRLRLAAIESMPVSERPSRRMLEWSVPAAATILVAFLGFSLLGEDMAEAADPALTVELGEEMAPEFGPLVPLMAAEAAPPVTADAPAPKANKPKANKPKSNKPKADKLKSETKAPVKQGHSNPLKLGDFDGNPLG